MPMPTLVALLMPLVLNVLLFMPWGFLMFILLDTPNRPFFQSYLLTFLIAIAFSFGVEAWQYFLPTRVTDVGTHPPDVRERTAIRRIEPDHMTEGTLRFEERASANGV